MTVTPNRSAEAIDWVIEVLRGAANGDPPTTAELDRHLEGDAYTGLPGPNSPKDFFAKQAALMGAEFSVSDQAATGLRASATLAVDSAKAWKLELELSKEAPHLISHCTTQPTVPGLRVRLATAADALALSEVERNSPIVLGTRRMTLDRGDDYFAAAQLMEQVAVAIGEIDGRPIGVFCGALVPARVDGKVTRRFIGHHLRMLPDVQSTGLWRAISIPVFEQLYGHADGGITYISPENEASQRTHNPDEKWSVRPIRALVDTRGHQTATTAATATIDDLPRVVEIVNSTHGDEEGFVPYTVESFLERISRAPHYTLNNIWLAGDAVLGVWPSGATTVTTIEEHGRVVQHRRALALDYGYDAAATDDFVSLVGVWSTWLRARGQDQLAIFTSTGSPTHNLVAALAAEIEPFDLWAGPEPEGAAQRGWHVDPVYF